VNLERLERWRAPHPLGWPQERGCDFGWFEVPTSAAGPWLFVQVSPGDGEAEGWEHASVSLRHRCPTWEEMCRVKDLIWAPEDTVMQFHPPKSDYVNRAKYCLHLWCYRGALPMPRPPRILV
jgi:hypothetical protein